MSTPDAFEHILNGRELLEDSRPSRAAWGHWMTPDIEPVRCQAESEVTLQTCRKNAESQLFDNRFTPEQVKGIYASFQAQQMLSLKAGDSASAPEGLGRQFPNRLKPKSPDSN